MALCSLVLELEEAFLNRRLSRRLTELEPRDVHEKEILACYRSLVEAAPGPLHHMRVDGVSALLSQFLSLFIPTTVFDAEIHDLPGVEPEILDLERERIGCVVVRVAGADAVVMRFVQAFDAAFWGTGFRFATSTSSSRFRYQFLRKAVRRLAGDIRGLGRIFERFQVTDGVQGLKIVSTHREKQFEHLILDILNEKQGFASAAPLYEDFLEKTDIRFKSPFLDRKRGARVQVTSIIAPDRHQAKIDGIRLKDEYVFLSPLSLAAFAVAIRDGVDYPRFSVPGPDHREIWSYLGGGHVDEMAYRIREHLFEAIKAPSTAPLGPMTNVASSIRDLVRVFVQDQAVRTTISLHERESASAARDIDGPVDVTAISARSQLDLKIGDRIRGRVANVVGFGVFVQYGRLQGLLHLSKTNDDDEGDPPLEIGSEIDVRVHDIDLEKMRLTFEMA